MNNALKNQTDDAGASLLDTIEPEIRNRLTSRRGLFAQAAAKLGSAATIPAVLAVASTEALGQGLPGSVTDVLNFALTLEYLEAEFYHRALTTPGLIPPRHRAAFAQIGKHEVEHVRTLQGALGGAAIASPSFDYTGRGQYPDVFSNFATFAAVSNTFEDLGVAAYKGQAPFPARHADVDGGPAYPFGRSTACGRGSPHSRIARLRRRFRCAKVEARSSRRCRAVHRGLKENGRSASDDVFLPLRAT